MSAKISFKIDQFYILLIIISGFLAVLVFFTSKRIYQSLSLLNKQEHPSVNQFKLNQGDLEKAYELIFNKKIISLDEGL